MSRAAWFDRPVVAVLVGGLLTAVVVPFAARRWAASQKELEVKTALVAEIADTVMTFITALTAARKAIFHRSGRPAPAAPAQDDGRLDVVRARFAVDQQVIGTRLEAYFGWSGIPQLWDQLCLAVELLAADGDGPSDPSTAKRRQADLNKKVEALWTALEMTDTAGHEADRDLRITADYPNQEWWHARIRLLYCKAEIVRRILRLPMPVFEWWYSRAHRRYRREERKRSTARPHRTVV